MAVSYTNNFNNIADKLLEVIKTEIKKLLKGKK